MIKTAALLVTVIFAVVGVHSTEADARHRRRSKTLTAKDKLFIEAAKALYGVGLKIKRSKRSTTVSSKRGGITQARYNRYVKEVYLEVLRAYLTKLHGGHWRWKKTGYMDPKGSRKRYRRRSTDPGKWDPRDALPTSAHLCAGSLLQ